MVWALLWQLLKSVAPALNWPWLAHALDGHPRDMRGVPACLLQWTSSWSTGSATFTPCCWEMPAWCSPLASRCRRRPAAWASPCESGLERGRGPGSICWQILPHAAASRAPTWAAGFWACDEFHATIEPPAAWPVPAAWRATRLPRPARSTSGRGWRAPPTCPAWATHCCAPPAGRRSTSASVWAWVGVEGAEQQDCHLTICGLTHQCWLQ